MRKYYLLLLAMLLLNGCAQTVTQPPTGGTQITFNINFRSDLDTSKNRYYIILSDKSSLLAPSTSIYFFGPGEVYEPSLLYTSSLDYYYQTYFSTWSDYILLSSEIFKLVNGSFGTSGTKHYDFSLNSLAVRSVTAKNSLTLSFYLSRLSATPTTWYFNFITTDSTGYAADSLSTVQSIPNEANATFSGSDEGAAIDPSLDILNWSATIL